MTEKPTRKRFSILAMIFVSVVVNYLDRSNISIAASAFKADLQLDTVQMGYILSAFSLTYALLQLPGGVVVDLGNPTKIIPFYSNALVAGYAGAGESEFVCRVYPHTGGHRYF